METAGSIEKEDSWFRRDATGLRMHQERLMDAISSPSHGGKYRIRTADSIGFIDREKVLQELRATNKQLSAIESQTEIEVLHTTVTIVILTDTLQPDRLEHHGEAEKLFSLPKPLCKADSISLQPSSIVYQI